MTVIVEIHNLKWSAYLGVLIQIQDESVNMDDREHLQPILDSYGVFKPIRTIPLFGIHLIFSCALTIIAICYAAIHPDEKSKCREYFVIIYLHIGLWFLTLIIDRLVKCHHHNLKINGYLDFYQQTQLHISLPFYVVSLWSVTLMFLQALMQHFYPDDFAEKCIKGGSLSPISYLCAIITLEFCVIAGININYIAKVINFNKQKPLPDVQREEWTSTTSPDSLAQSEVGYRQLGDKVYDLLDKQAKYINFLKEHNERLGEKTMILNAQLQQLRAQRNQN
ncbi:transmembrane protein 192 isoform X1 [Diorhabda sublineata]|uniref:transmembrane protein 192 isoform X1 n=1 Tax=Diorhabda sublineata TaxID=1163346 RepID=UPI0024E0A09E|nr:transmembrane protein 192 isoform X1 [Diorhabda sublineata]